MSCEKSTRSRGTITVVSPENFAELLQDFDTRDKVVEDGNRRLEGYSSRRSVPHVRSKSVSTIGTSPKQETKRHTSSDLSKNIGDWLSEKSVQDIQEKTAYGSTVVKNICASLLENERDLMKETENYLEDNAILNNRKKLLLVKKWHENVYFPLMAKVEQEMHGCHYRYFDREKRYMYQKYLEYLNHKGDVFLDVMSQNEYDPLRLVRERPGPLKAIIPSLEDPLLHQESKRKDEERVLMACDTGTPPSDKRLEEERLPPLPFVPLGRHGTECHSWLSMELRDIQSEKRSRSQKRIWGMRNHSSLPVMAWRAPDSASSQPRYTPKGRRSFKEKHESTLVLA